MVECASVTVTGPTNIFLEGRVQMCNSQVISPYCYAPPLLYYVVFPTTTTFSYTDKGILVMRSSDPLKVAFMEQFLWLTQ